MRAETFIFFLWGVVLQMAWLWVPVLLAHADRKGKDQPASRLPGWLAGLLQRLNPGWGVGMAAGAVALILVLVLRLMGISDVIVSLDDGWVGLIFVALGLILLVSGILAGAILPRVDERVILSVQIVLLINLYLRGNPLPHVPLVGLAGFVGLFTLALAVTRFHLPPLAKVGVYAWHLFSLLLMAFQDDALAYFSSTTLSNFDGLIFGIFFFFILLQGLFAVRFFLIATSLVFPRNWKRVANVMPRLYSDGQAPPLRVLLIVIGLPLVLILLSRLNLLREATLIQSSLLVITQALFHVPGRGTSGKNGQKAQATS